MLATIEEIRKNPILFFDQCLNTRMTEEDTVQTICKKALDLTEFVELRKICQLETEDSQFFGFPSINFMRSEGDEGSLVHFRGLVQDVVEGMVQCTLARQKKDNHLISTKYRPALEVDQHDLLMDTMTQRSTLNMVEIPGWTTDARQDFEEEYSLYSDIEEAPKRCRYDGSGRELRVILDEPHDVKLHACLDCLGVYYPSFNALYLIKSREVHLYPSSPLTRNPDPQPCNWTDMHTALSGILEDSLVATLVILFMVQRGFAAGAGYFSLNLTNVDDERRQALAQFLEAHMAAVRQFHLKDLGSLALSPVKDYDNDVLERGVLQNAAGTTLIFHERAVENLDKKSENFLILEKLVQTRKLQCKFYTYFTFDMETPVLTLSEGPGHLGLSRLQLPLAARTSMPGEGTLPVRGIPSFRAYIREIKGNPRELSLTDDMHGEVCAEYVRNRQSGGPDNEESLTLKLTLAQLLVSAYREPRLSPEMWAHLNEMEQEIRARCTD